MPYKMAGRLMSGLYDLLGRSAQMSEAGRGAVRHFAVLPLIVGGLLAASSGAGTAQCWNCVGSDFGEPDSGSTLCAGGNSGSSYCGQIGDDSRHYCIRLDVDDCEDDLFAMDSTSDREAIGTVMAGRMLVANAGYYFVIDGESTVIRRKCGNALVARISNADQQRVLAINGERNQGLDGMGVWRSETALGADIAQ